MPRSARDKIQQGTRRMIPAIHRFVNSTPAALAPMHLFRYGTNPPAGSYAGAALAATQIVGGASPSPTTGIINPIAPTAPAKNYLTRAHLKNLVAGGTGTLYLIDALVSYKTITTNVGTGAQNMTGSAVNTDIRPRTGRKDSQVFADVATALGATPANLTLSYTRTNDLTTGARSTGAQALTASALVAQIPLAAGPFLALQAGDQGVASIQSATVSALMGSGVIDLIICDVLAVLDINTDLQGVDKSFGNTEEADGLLEVPSGAALSLIWVPNSSTAGQRLQLDLTIVEADLAAA